MSGYSIVVRAFITALAFFLCAQALAQQNTDAPPVSSTQSPSGVNFDSGAFSFENVDLSIGGESPGRGLEFKRQYRSNLSTAFSSGFKAQGWTYSLHVAISTKMIPTARPISGKEPYLYSISYGDRSVGFLGGSQNPTGGFVGTYTPVFGGSETLVYSGTASSGTFTFTDNEGNIILIQNQKVTSWIIPNGVILTYNYDGSGLLKSIFSSGGYALLFDGAGKWDRVCAVNLAETYVAALSNCPADAQSVTYTYSSDGLTLTGVTAANNQTTTYEYAAAGGAYHLSCMKPAGQATCEITNHYNVCKRDPSLSQDPPGLRLMDQVVSQVTATGENFIYSFGANPVCPRQNLTGGVTMTSPAGSTIVVTNKSGMPTSITDPLGNQTTSTYGTALYSQDSPYPNSVTQPEGNRTEYQYGPRRNPIEVRQKAKPGSTLSDMYTSAVFPATCANVKTCNKPTSTTDARGNTTSYTYDSAHGGPLTETAPAVDGVAPVKRYTYVQRYPWLKNAGGGVAQSTAPVWLLSEERTCRTTATVGNACAGGAADEVVSAYDYGPDTGLVGNTLLLRGKTVTAEDADGVIRSYRSCFGYDRDGNKIWEASPRAGLANCY